MIISPHARNKMNRLNIPKEDIEKCFKDGKPVIKQIIKGEMRYGKVIDLKDRKLVIIYTYEKSGETRIITTYYMRRKLI